MALIVWFALRSWHQRAAKLLLIMLGVVYLASLGPTLHVANHSTIALPWALVTSYLPLLNIALPARFMMFGWLITAVIGAIWLARKDIAITAKIALALLSVVFLFPDPLFLWHAQTQINTPQFFSRGLYRHYIRPDENVLIIPYGKNGDSMLWQAQTRMDFRMAEGWTGLVPPEFLRWPILNTFNTANLMRGWQTQLKAFLAAHDVEAVVISYRAGDFSQRLMADTLGAALREFTSARSANSPWEELMSTLDVQPIRVGGITLYEVPAQLITEHRGANILELETTADAAWFSTLLAVGEKYLSNGQKLDKLSPARARELGLLPPGLWAPYLYVASDWKRAGSGNGLWLGPWARDMVCVGLFGSYPAVNELISRYGSSASEIYFPYPNRFTRDTPDDRTPHFLLMTFSRQGLAQAARQSASIATGNNLTQSVAGNPHLTSPWSGGGNKPLLEQ